MIDNVTTQRSWTMHNAATYYRFRLDDATKWTEAELRFRAYGTRSIWQWDKWDRHGYAAGGTSVWRNG